MTVVVYKLVYICELNGIPPIGVREIDWLSGVSATEQDLSLEMFPFFFSSVY